MTRRVLMTFVLQLLAIGAPAAATTGAMQPVALDVSGTIGVRWDATPGATGYRVHYGIESGDYVWAKDVGPATSTTLEGLANCTQYFVAVMAYNDAGDSPQYSNEISGWARPAVSFNDTTVMTQGGQYVIQLEGANFDPDAEMTFEITDVDGNPLVHVESLEVESCTAIQALVTVEPAAPGLRAMEIGTHTLKILNPDGVVGSSDYEVELNPIRLDVNDSETDTNDRVDGKDLVWLAFSHGSGEGEERYNPDADLNGDGYVDGEDLAHLATAFGRCWTGSEWTTEACPQ